MQHRQVTRKYLVTSDIHLNEKPQDDYRYKLFPWLARQCRQRHITDLCILGDLTDAKDRHAATLVQKIVDALYVVLDHTDVHIHICLLYTSPSPRD